MMYRFQTFSAMCCRLCLYSREVTRGVSMQSTVAGRQCLRSYTFRTNFTKSRDFSQLYKYEKPFSIAKFQPKNNTGQNPNMRYHNVPVVLKKSPGYVPVRSFHTSSRRNVPPFLWLFIKPIAKIGAILTGRGTRKWWRSLPRDKKFVILGQVLEKWHLYTVGAVGLLTGGIVYYRLHLEDCPITNRRRFIAFTHSQFIKIVQAEADMYIEKFNDQILPLDSPKVDRVKRVTLQLVNGNKELKEMMGTQWSICVVDEPEVKNAFVLPSGHIFVFTGLLDFMDNDDQLAIVIGHEMSHALLSHAAEQLSFAQLIDVFVIGVMAAIWTLMPTDGLAVVTQWFYNKCIQLMWEMPYSRKLEQEADKVGLQLAAKACFDVREGSVFWTKMSLCEDQQQSKGPEWLSTHPLTDKRIEHLNFLMSDALRMREDSKCPKLKVTDPRETIKMVSKMVEQEKIARITRQNLRQVHHAHPQDRPVL